MTLTADRLRAQLRAEIAASTWADTAARYGVSVGTLQNVCRGRAPGPATLAALGYRRVYLNGGTRPVLEASIAKAAKHRAQRLGGYRQAAKALGVNIALLHATTRGNLSPAVVRALGFTVGYARLN